ncbi:MAG: adenylate/guanylate cyclase domain-containing protein [Gammaproteobacteria bacterium]|nr:adenylate/guanylate cyclase domain-containing protein [Gammaproteobacteria bacterium]
MIRQQSARLLFSLLIVLVFLLHTANVFPISFLQKLENVSYDVRLNTTLPKIQDRRIVILDIDEKSLAALGRWPWSRNRMATLVDNLFDKYQIKVLGFDILFAEQDTSSGLPLLQRLAREQLRDNPAFLQQLEQLQPQLEYDQLFATSLQGRKVLLSYYFKGKNNVDGHRRIGQLPTAISEIPPLWRGRLLFKEPVGYSANLAQLQSAALGGGFFDNPLVDIDGIFRRVPLLQLFENHLYESLALAVARAALNENKVQIVVASNKDKQGGYSALEAIKLGNYTIPVDAEAAVLIPYRGPQNSFPYISIIDLFNDQVDEKLLKDAIVLVGTTAPGLLDLRSTPVQNVYPGVEIHANIISGILNQNIKHQPAYTLGYTFLLLVLIGLIMSTLLPRISPLHTSLLTLAMAATITTMSFYAWNRWNLVLPMATPLLLTLSLFILHMSYGFFVESRSKRQLARLFGQYIPPELVNEMDQHLDDEVISLEGQSREMSVLFTDVRGFTPISEGLEPKELSQLMNAFLTPMTRTIHKHRGTIDKYMGDAIMAFWGAPLKDEQHAEHALNSAMEMIETLEEMQADFQAKGWPEIKIGVGLNTGPMSVGNMGSEFRMAYTVLGDAVNLSSRLEGLTKVYGVNIIVSDTTRHSVHGYLYRKLDHVRVKGKQQPVAIYEPLGRKEQVRPSIKSELSRYHKALRLYQRQQWDLAEREFFALTQQNSACYVYQLYLDRVIYFKTRPPEPDWDGVFTHHHK